MIRSLSSGLGIVTVAEAEELHPHANYELVSPAIGWLDTVLALTERPCLWKPQIHHGAGITEGRQVAGGR
jgi:hypothetical protein